MEMTREERQLAERIVRCLIVVATVNRPTLSEESPVWETIEVQAWDLALTLVCGSQRCRYLCKG